MLYFSRWKVTAILLATLVVCLFAVPNFFPDKVVQSWPKWAQRHIVLGLDLQGGSHILLEVDSNAVRKEKLETLRDDVRRVLREARIGYTSLVVRGTSVEVRLREGSDSQTALAKLRELSQPMGGILSTTGLRTAEVSDVGGGLFRLTVPEPALIERIRQSVDQSIQIVERRVNELGTVEPSIQRQGVDRILVQVPGLQDPARLKELLGKTAKLTFRMVDQSVTPEQAQSGSVPPESELLKGSKAENNQPYVIEKRVVVSGEDLTDAQPGFDQRTSEPIVTFRFNTNGARRFAQATQQNVGRPFAIVLDNEVISAPVIREPILGGSGQISGNFTVEQANDLAILLRAGALPAPLTIIEERTVGAGLGQDSIEKGKIAAYVGSVLVFVYIFMTYGLLRIVRQSRRRHQRGDDFRRPVDAQCDADIARHRRNRAHGRHGGGCERADFRAHARGSAYRPFRDQRHRRRLQPRAGDNPGRQHHNADRGQRAVLRRQRTGSRFRADAGNRYFHHGVHRVYPLAADRVGLGALVASDNRSDLTEGATSK